MADPISVSGTAVGIISLGFQVSQGLVEYYSQWKHFDGDVNAMYSSIEQLDHGFGILKRQLESPKFAIFSSVHELETSIQSCESGVLALKRKLEKIRQKEPLENLNEKDAFLNDLKRQGKRLLYPFQRGTLGKLRDVVSELRDGLQPILHAMQMDMSASIYNEVKEIQNINLKQRRDEEAQKVLAWLSPLSFHEKYQEILSARHPSTGSWFLKHEKFLAWRDTAPEAPRGLWCIGNMGTGKSVLLATAIEHLRLLPDREAIVVAYIFCDWQERMSQTEENIVGSIVQQIVENLSDMSPTVISYYRAYKDGKKQPSVQDLHFMFHELVKSFSNVYIIVDGLDELGSGDAVPGGVSMASIESGLKALLDNECEKSARVNLLISSRFTQQAEEGKQDFESITVSADTEELQAFIYSELETTSRTLLWINSQLGQRMRHDTELRNQVAELCLGKADKTYLLPRLHINHLKHQLNVKQLLKATRSLSVDISRSIRQTLDRIQSQTETLNDLAMRALYWILEARRPLQINELRHALTLDLDDTIEDDNSNDDEYLQTTTVMEDLIPQALIVASCAGLISVNEETGVVRLIHLTVAQYLQNPEYKLFPPIHAAISKVCLHCLSNKDFVRPDSGNENLIKHWLSRDPLLRYSLQYWGHHAHLAPEEAILGDIKSLLLSRDRIDFLFRGLYWVLWATLSPCADQIPELFLTSYFGLTCATRELLEDGNKADQVDSMGRNALYIASALGHTDIVKMLLLSNANVSGRKIGGSWRRTLDTTWWLPPWARDDYATQALCAAAESGYLEVVRTLIENGAKVSDPGSFHDGALEAATFSGHIEVVKFLLQHKALITRNTLQSSAYSGRTDILEELLQILKPRPDSGIVTKEAVTQDLPKALYAAALADNIPYVKRLLEYGIDPNVLTKTSYRTPLQAAASRGHLDMMTLLLQHGANVDSHTKIEESQYLIKGTPGTALEAAAFKGQVKALELLLKNGASLNHQSGYYGNALQAGAVGGHLNVIEILLQHKAEVNSECGFYGNLLQAAASIGSKALIVILLDAGADANAAGGIFGYPLQAAVWNGSLAVVELLLGAGAKLDNEGGRFSNALQAAAVGHPLTEPCPIIDLPKASTFPLDFQSYESRSLDRLAMQNFTASQIYGSRIQRATESQAKSRSKHIGHMTSIERTLLQTNEGEVLQEILESPQSSTQNLETVTFLLDAGVDVNKIGGKFQTALKASCYAGHLETAILLLDHGADLAIFQDMEDYPWLRDDALSRAIESGHTAVVRLLLERGADPTTHNPKGDGTPLHRAAMQNSEMVQLLVLGGADINAIDKQGSTPLISAVSSKKPGIVTILLQHGADLNRSSTHPLTHAIILGPTEVIRAILQGEASVEAINNALQRFLLRYFSPLNGCVIEQVRDPLKLLLERGANVNIGVAIADRDAILQEVMKEPVDPPYYMQDLNPLSTVAARFGDEVELVRMVVEAGADLEVWGMDALWLATCKGHSRIKEYLKSMGVTFENGQEEGVIRAAANVEDYDPS